MQLFIKFPELGDYKIALYWLIGFAVYTLHAPLIYELLVDYQNFLGMDVCREVYTRNGNITKCGSFTGLMITAVTWIGIFLKNVYEVMKVVEKYNNRA